MTVRETISAARTAGPLPQADGARAFEFTFPPDAPFFAGHFPLRPILPGVFQLEMVRLAAEWIRHTRLDIREVARAKFRRPILPGEVLHLNVKLTDNEGLVAAHGQFTCGGQAAGEAWLKLSL